VKRRRTTYRLTIEEARARYVDPEPVPNSREVRYIRELDAVAADERRPAFALLPQAGRDSPGMSGTSACASSSSPADLRDFFISESARWGRVVEGA
jgi:hypothetical protein